MGNLPELSASAAFGYKNGILTIDNSDLNKPLFNWNVGIALNVPVFDGFLDSNKVSEAADNLDAASRNTEALTGLTRTEVVQAAREKKAGRDQVENSLVLLEQAKESFEIAKTQYDPGVITNLQYLDSQTSIEKAKYNSLSAVYREVLSDLELKKAVGE